MTLSQTVLSSGQIQSGEPITSGATLIVLNGATAVDLSISADGSLTLSSGATANDITVGSGGAAYVSAGATASNTTVASGGSAYVYAGGVANGTTVSSGGTAYVSSGGIASDTTVVSGGSEFVLVGGSGVATSVRGGLDVVGSGGSAINAAVTRDGGQILSGGSSFGTMVSSGGYEFMSFGGVAVDTTVNNGAQQQIGLGGSALNTIVQRGGTEILYSGGTIYGTTLEAGATIDLPFLTYDSSISKYFDTGTQTLVVANQVESVTLTLAGGYTDDYFHLSADNFDGTEITAEGTPCYCRGTHLRTDRGDLRVETLHIGDALVTMSGHLMPIRWIGRRSYSGRFATANRNVLPVEIKQGALEGGLPVRDLRISPCHAMFLGNKLIPAIALVNGESIIQPDSVDDIEYFHVELDCHAVIFAEGALSESFVDAGNRAMFENAEEYPRLYPDADRHPPTYCAPRVEDGEELEAVRRSIARTLRAAGHRGTPPATGPLQGYLERVGERLIQGWAYDGGSPVMVRLVHNGVVMGEVLADQYRDDLEKAGFGQGRHGFALSVSGGLSPRSSHVIQAQRASDGRDLGNSPWFLAAMVGGSEANQAEAAVDADGSILEIEPQIAPICGQLDAATHERIVGWAFCGARPNEAVALQIVDNGVPVARVLANRYRKDLEDAGIGIGRHAFELGIPGGLSPLTRHVVRVLYEATGRDMPGSPAVIEASTVFDEALERAVTNAVLAPRHRTEQERVLHFMAGQVDRLLQQMIDSKARSDTRALRDSFRRRFGTAITKGEEVAATSMSGRPESTALRALVIDDRTPDAGRDGGSLAVLSHMRALQSIGYTVSFAAADNLPSDANAVADLEASGIRCHRAPFCISIEELLRREQQGFGLIYLHRISNASKYLALCRYHFPQARVIYAVADLHHVRLARQAVAEERQELLAQSRSLRLAECTAAWSADAVVTHSPVEAEMLRQMVPTANVHVVPWTVPVARRPRRSSRRKGVAFIGNYAHPPNLDAAFFLAQEIMPLVWGHDPSIECLLVGSQMPAAVRRLARHGVTPLGHVADLAAIFDRVRLTVAPLRYGSGIKGKMLMSLAAGVPCVASPIAAEGLDLPGPLATNVDVTAAGLAERIIRLHTDRRGYRRAVEAGLEMIKNCFSEPQEISALRAAITPSGQSPRFATTAPLTSPW